MFTNELIAGLYLAACVVVAIGCWYVATTRPRHPLTVATVAVLFALLVRQAWRVAVPNTSVPAGANQAKVVLSSESVRSAGAGATVVAISDVPAAVPVVANSVIPANVPSGNMSRVWPNVARWHSHIKLALSRCGLAQATGQYDALMLMAAIVAQESGGAYDAIGRDQDTGLAQVVPREHPSPMFRDRPSQQELLDPQFNLDYAACLLRDNIHRYGSVRGGLAAYNGSSSYPDVILAHYAKFTSPQPQPQPQPVVVHRGCCQWPVRAVITQQPSARHMALDIGATLGTPIGAAAGGQVVAVGWAGDYGKRVMIEHGNGLSTLYAHLSEFAVLRGDFVQSGQVIGRIGSTGKSTGPHLHFEVRLNGVRQNPWDYLPAGP